MPMSSSMTITGTLGCYSWHLRMKPLPNSLRLQGTCNDILDIRLPPYSLIEVLSSLMPLLLSSKKLMISTIISLHHRHLNRIGLWNAKIER